MVKDIVIRVPASTGNIGSGFDCAALSLSLYNEFFVSRSRKNFFEVESSLAAGIEDAFRDLFFLSFAEGARYLNLPECGIGVRLANSIPVGKGLGSSATVVLAGLIAAFIFAGAPVKKKEILRLAIPMEGHIDNLAASLYSGFVISGVDGGRINVFNKKVCSGLRIIVFVPDALYETKKSRALLPDKVPMQDAVYNMSHFGFLCAAFISGDLSLLGCGVKDRLHQQYRASAMPYLDNLESAIGRGIMGASLSGAGPSVAFYSLKEDVSLALNGVAKFLAENRLTGDVFVFSPNGKTEWKILV